MDSDYITVIAALIGAVGGSFGATIIGDVLKRRYDKERDLLRQKSDRETGRKNITYKYLIQLQYAVESLRYRFLNVGNQGGSLYGFKVIGNEDYYAVSSLYVLGSVLAYHRIMISEGVYSQIEDLYPSFGTQLIKKFEGLAQMLSNITVTTFETSETIPFFRYDKVALGDALTDKDNGHLRISSYLDFKRKYETDSQMASSLKPAREFVEHLPNASDDITIFLNELKDIGDILKSKTFPEK